MADFTNIDLEFESTTNQMSDTIIGDIVPNELPDTENLCSNPYEHETLFVTEEPAITIDTESVISVASCVIDNYKHDLCTEEQETNKTQITEQNMADFTNIDQQFESTTNQTSKTIIGEKSIHVLPQAESVYVSSFISDKIMTDLCPDEYHSETLSEIKVPTITTNKKGVISVSSIGNDNYKHEACTMEHKPNKQEIPEQKILDFTNIDLEFETTTNQMSETIAWDTSIQTESIYVSRLISDKIVADLCTNPHQPETVSKIEVPAITTNTKEVFYTYLSNGTDNNRHDFCTEEYEPNKKNISEQVDPFKENNISSHSVNRKQKSSGNKELQQCAVLLDNVDLFFLVIFSITTIIGIIFSHPQQMKNISIIIFFVVFILYSLRCKNVFDACYYTLMVATIINMYLIAQNQDTALDKYFEFVLRLGLYAIINYIMILLTRKGIRFIFKIKSFCIRISLSICLYAVILFYSSFVIYHSIY